MAKSNGSENGEVAAAYVGWGTFKNSILDGMAEGLPNVIGKSIFVGMAGGVQSHMMASLKFLCLIDDEGRPTAELTRLVSGAEQDQKAVLAEILNNRYSALISLGLDKASMKQLTDTLERVYRVTGDTTERAARFFISAAQYAGIPLSRHIMEGAISVRRRRSSRRPATAPTAPAESIRDSTAAASTVPPSPVGEHRVVQLVSGGTLTLSASVGFMKLAKSDRDFVFGLIDQLDSYEANNADEGDD